MYHFVHFCISNFTVFNISEIILFRHFYKKCCLVYYYQMKSSQNGIFSWLVSQLAKLYFLKLNCQKYTLLNHATATSLFIRFFVKSSFKI